MALLKKDRIKDQMIKTAAKLWGVEDGEIVNNFDPLIILLIEACAAELEKINHDISSSHTRLLDNIADLILPEALFGATPASGIIHAMPVESKTNINSNSAFYATQQIQNTAVNRTETVELYFSPIGNFSLFKADLSYVFLGNNFFRIKENNSKELIFSSDKSSNSNQVWLAINPDKALESLNGLSIYFDLHSHSSAHNFYNSLAYTKGFINDTPIHIAGGYEKNSGAETSAGEMLSSGNGRTNKLNRKVAFTYQNRFINIREDVKTAKSEVPQFFKEHLSAEIIKPLVAENLVYIKIELPQFFPQEVFDVLTCSINAFPAVNKKLKTFSYRTDDWINIVPLPLDGVFFDLAEIKSEKGEPYKIRPSAVAKELVAGEAIVRAGGVGKTSSREVREMINSITEAIRDQSAYFGQLNNEFILERLREIGKTLSGLEDHMAAATDKKEEYTYLMLRPKQNKELISIDYWITNGADANQVKPGALLAASSSAGVNSKRIFTLTNFSGGKSRVSEADKRTLLKQQLVSGGKIVSAEDVKLLCKQLWGDKLKTVEVEKSVQVSNKKEEGFKRTIDVIITYSNLVNDSMKSEMDTVIRELEFILQNNASPVYPFRVIIQNDLTQR